MHVSSSPVVYSFIYFMENVAPCMFDDCCECALRKIERSDLSEHSCHGGVDLLDFSYHSPCTTCYARIYPATQDYQDYDLNGFLAPEKNEKVPFEVEGMDLTESMIWGIHPTNERLIDDEMTYTLQRNELCKKTRWPIVRRPLKHIKKCEGSNGTKVTFRFYKPFKPVQSAEIEDFKKFLRFIF